MLRGCCRLRCQGKPSLSVHSVKLTAKARLCCALLFTAAMFSYCYLAARNHKVAAIQQSLPSSEPKLHDRGIKSAGSRKIAKLHKPRKTRLRPMLEFLMQPSDEWIKNISLNRNRAMFSFIKSTPNRTRQRQRLRKMLNDEHPSSLNEIAFATVFVLGQSEDAEKGAGLEVEHRLFGDILQFRGNGTPGQVYLKTLAGMQWASDHLPAKSLYSSGTDDITVNVARLRDAIGYSYEKMHANRWPEMPLLCGYKKLTDATPRRHGPVRVSLDRYKWPYYPASCHAAFYTMRIEFVAQLYALSRTLPPLASADHVWVTGTLRKRLGMPDPMLMTPQYEAVKCGAEPVEPWDPRPRWTVHKVIRGKGGFPGGKSIVEMLNEMRRKNFYNRSYPGLDDQPFPKEFPFIPPGAVGLRNETGPRFLNPMMELI